MPFICKALQRVIDCSAGPFKAMGVDTYFLCEFIGSLKPHTSNIFCQSVGIFTNKGDSVLSIGFKNPKSSCGSYSIRLQKNHDISNGFIFFPALANEFDAFWPQTFYLFKKAGRLINDLKCFKAKHGNDFLGITGPNSFNKAGP